MTMLFEDGRRRTLQNSYLHRRPSLQTRLSVLFFYFHSGQERHQTDLRVARALMLGDCNPMSKVCLVSVARVLRDRLTRVKAVTRNLFRHRFSVPFFSPSFFPLFQSRRKPEWGPQSLMRPTNSIRLNKKKPFSIFSPLSVYPPLLDSKHRITMICLIASALLYWTVAPLFWKWGTAISSRAERVRNFLRPPWAPFVLPWPFYGPFTTVWSHFTSVSFLPQVEVFRGGLRRLNSLSPASKWSLKSS